MIDQLYIDNPISQEIDQIYTFSQLALPTAGMAFSFEGKTYHRPYIIFNMVSSVDGKATTHDGELTGLGSKTDRTLMTRLRSQVDAAVVGGGTLRVDPFIPTVPPELMAERLSNFASSQPLGIVVSNSGDLPLDHRFWQAGKDLRLVFLGDAASNQSQELLSTKAQVLRLPNNSDGKPNLAVMLDLLWRDFGVKRLLVEGGAGLNFSFIAQGWCDEIFLSLSPKLVGGIDNHTIIAGQGFGMFPALPSLTLRSLYHHQSELFLRYQIG